jgi:hypothetical protein
MNHSTIIIPFVITFIYAITLPLEHYISIEENSNNYISDRIFLANTNQTTAVQQDGELEENEPITDLPSLIPHVNQIVLPILNSVSICVYKITYYRSDPPSFII